MVYFRYFIWFFHRGCASSSPFFIDSYLFCGTRVKPLARLQFDVTWVTSMHSSYSAASFLMVLSIILMSISLAALVRTLALPDKVSGTQWYTQESVRICNILTPHWSARLIPFSAASSSTRLICASSFNGYNQHAS